VFEKNLNSLAEGDSLFFARKLFEEFIFVFSPLFCSFNLHGYHGKYLWVAHSAIRALWFLPGTG